MISNHNSASVSVLVNPVTSSHALEDESVRLQRTDKLTSGETARRVASCIDDNGWFGKFNRVAVFRNRFPSLDQVLDIQVDGFTEICECLFIGVAPSMTSFQGWAGTVPGFSTVLKFVRLHNDFENIGFHVYHASLRCQSLNQT